MRKLASGLVFLLVPMLLLASPIDDPETTRGRSAGPKSRSLLSVHLDLGLAFPTGQSETVFDVGAGMRAGIHYRLASLPFLYVSAALGYTNASATGIFLTASMVSVAAGGGLRADILPGFAVAAGISAGGFGCFLSGSDTWGANLLVSADARMIFLPGPSRLTIGASYRYFVNFYSGLDAFLGFSFELPSTSVR